MQQILDFLLHIDDQLLKWVQVYGGYTYAILFLIIFAETGLVFIPFSAGRFAALRGGRDFRGGRRSEHLGAGRSFDPRGGAW
jgi:hypothetical protein